MTVRPKISVITASKNGGCFLRETLDSILRQTFTDYEHIVVDCASTDNTVEILKEYKDKGYNVKWISEPDRHADEGFYKAAHMARGEYVMFSCISDGYLDRDWFAKCVEVLDNNPDVSLVYGLAQQMSENGILGKVTSSTFLNTPPPQKMDFFVFWLGTFALGAEITFCVRANVFKKCFPKFETTGYFLQNHAVLAFSYNFNVNGYLPYFLPSIVTYGRCHHDSETKKAIKLNRLMKKQYRSAVNQYGNEVLWGGKKHFFQDGNSKVIKEIEPDELKFYRRKAFHYRLNRKAYLGKRESNYLSPQIRNLKISIDHFLFQRLKCY